MLQRQVDDVVCQEEVDLQAVQLLSEDDLSFLGVSHSAHRRAVLAAAARLAQEQRSLQPPHEQRQALAQAREGCQVQEGSRGQRTSDGLETTTPGHTHVQHAGLGQLLKPLITSRHGNQLHQASSKHKAASSACPEPLQRMSRGTVKLRTAAKSTSSRQAELRLLGALYPPPADSMLGEAALSQGGFVCGMPGPPSGGSQTQQLLQPHGTARAGRLASEDDATHRHHPVAGPADVCQTPSVPELRLQGAAAFGGSVMCFRHLGQMQLTVHVSSNSARLPLQQHNAVFFGC